MSNEKIDWNKVTVGPAEGEKSGEVAGESVEGGTIEAQTEKVEQEIGANMATLNENVARLPEPETVSVDEHPGLRAHLERYKQSILDNRNDTWTKVGGLVVPGAGVLMGSIGGAGVEFAAAAVAFGALMIASDKIVGRINAYLQTKKHEREILAGETN